MTSSSYVTTWTEDAVHAFLNEMGAAILEFSKKRTPRATYDNISIELKKQNFKFSAQELVDKKRGLDTTFGRVVKKGNLTKVTWPYFEGLQYIKAGYWPPGFVSAKKTSNNTSGTLLIHLNIPITLGSGHLHVQLEC